MGSTMVSGRKTSNTVKVLRPGLMELSMKVTTFMERRTVKENSLGLMDPLIMVPSRTITFKAMVLTTGLMEESSRETGSTTRWRAAVYSNGPMEDAMKVNMSMTRRRVKVLSTGQMADSTREAGRMASSTAKEPTPLLKARLEWESGLMEGELLGSIRLLDSLEW